MIRRTAVAAAGVLLLVACSSAADSAEPSAGSAAATGSNGTVYTVVWDDQVGLATHGIAADGSLGPPVELLSTPADERALPGVVDGLGPNGLIGIFDGAWTESLRRYEGSRPVAELAAPEWCGGEGLAYSLCVLLDDSRVARTTVLGGDPGDGEGPTASPIIVSSLTDGSTLAEYGPVADLVSIVGTQDPDQLMLVTSPFTGMEDSQPSTVLRMDLTDGTTTPVGTSAPGWAALCAIGSDSVLGFTIVSLPSDAGPRSASTASVVGPAEIADIGWDDQDVLGCSADGRFLYLQRFPQPPSGELDDEAPNPPTSVDRVTLADGRRDPVLVLNPGVQVAMITR